jgi:hypothetical protein
MESTTLTGRIGLAFVLLGSRRLDKPLVYRPFTRRGLGSLTMAGSSKTASPPSDTPDSLLRYVERLRQRAGEFRDTVDEDFRKSRALLAELLARQARRRDGADEPESDS